MSLKTRGFLVPAVIFTAITTQIPRAQAAGDKLAMDARIAEIAASQNGKFPLGAATEIAPRGGLPNFFARASRGEPLTVVFYGTSVTRPPGWRKMTSDWLETRFPNAKLTIIDASIGGTGSIAGAFRADQDLVPHRPDLVFIEFAGNDNPDTRSRPLDVLRAVEGIVRKTRAANPQADLCFTYAFGHGDFPTLLAGQAPRGATLHDMVAAHYMLPSVHMSMEVARLEQAGRLVNQASATPNGLTADGKIIFTNDGSHPTIPAGHRVWAERVIAALQEFAEVGEESTHPLPEPLMPDHWAAAKTIHAEGNSRLQGGWEWMTRETEPSVTVENRSVYDWVPRIARTTEPGAYMEVRFRGTVVGWRGVTGPDSAIVEVSVDEGLPVRECQFTTYTQSFGYGGKPLASLPVGEHRARWTLSAEKVDKRTILDSDKRRPRGADVIAHPEKYAPQSLTASEILLVGEIIPPTRLQPE